MPFLKKDILSTGYFIMDSTGYIDSKLGIENDN